MRKALVSLALLAALLFAGCSGKDEDKAPEPVTCPDGTVLTSEQIEAIPGHHEAGFNATAHCPVPPTVHLEGIPASLQTFKTAAFKWVLDNGTTDHAHSMLTSVRYSDRSIPDRDLTNINKVPNELIKREHQNLPITYTGNLSFSKAGKVYIRAYMEVAGVDHWSPEYVLTVTPVVSTGKVVDVVQGAGDFLAPPTPNAVEVVLGDSVRFTNSDAREHTCTFQSGPAQMNDFKAAATNGASDPQMLVVPGVYQFSCDDLQPQSFTIDAKLNP